MVNKIENMKHKAETSQDLQVVSDLKYYAIPEAEKRLAENGKNTILWGPFPENLREIREKRENKFLKGVTLPENILIEESMENAVENAELLVLAAPSQYMRGTLEKLKEYFDSGRINFLGKTEMGYIESYPEEVRRKKVELFMSKKPACVVVTRSLPCPDELLEFAKKYEVPLLVTNDTTLIIFFI